MNEREREVRKALRKYEAARKKAWEAFDAIEKPAYAEYQRVLKLPLDSENAT